MEFKKILFTLLKNFEENDIRYGLIGGFALIFMEIPRTTVDIDFLIHKDDLSKVQKIMENMGYKLVFRTENVSQYVGKTESLGEIDFIHAFRKYSLRMLERARTLEKEGLKIRVLIPEDIIGLKVQAMANAPSRKTRELSDIEAIIEKFKNKIDWSIVEEYFKIFNLQDEFKKLKEEHDTSV